MKEKKDKKEKDKNKLKLKKLKMEADVDGKYFITLRTYQLTLMDVDSLSKETTLFLSSLLLFSFIYEDTK